MSDENELQPLEFQHFVSSLGNNISHYLFKVRYETTSLLRFGLFSGNGTCISQREGQNHR